MPEDVPQDFRQLGQDPRVDPGQWQPTQTSPQPGQQPGHIEVMYHEDGNDQPVEPSEPVNQVETIDGTVQRGDEPLPLATVDHSNDAGYIADESSAWDVAHAVKDERDAAADARVVIKTRRGIFDGIKENYNKFRAGEITEEELKEEDYKLADKVGDLEGYYSGEDKNGNEGNQLQDLRYYAERGVRPDPEKFEKDNKSIAEYARQQDINAKHTEAWAEILLEHPISDSYKASREGVDFSAKALAEVERIADFNKDLIEMTEAMLDKAGPRTALEGLDLSEDDQDYFRKHFLDDEKELALEGKENPTSPYAVIRVAYGGRSHPSEEGKEKWSEWDKLKNGLSTTMAQFKFFYDDAFNVAYLNGKRNYANTSRALLDDIKSGRAS